MFADDTKLYREITSINDCQSLQEDLNNLAAWSNKWLLKFNEAKCVALKVKKRFDFQYVLNDHVLDCVTSQRDLGITISNNLKSSEHISNIVKNANRRIGMIKRCFTDLNQTKVSILYKSIIRPVLEYGSPVWNPNLQKDITELEKVQRRCLRLSDEKCSMPTLQERRNFADLCEVYKYTHNLYKNGITDMFVFSDFQLRGHSLKLRKPYCRTTTRQSFFSNRIIDKWNALPELAVEAPSLQDFKEILRSLPPA
jgi:hypothetical protein